MPRNAVLLAFWRRGGRQSRATSRAQRVNDSPQVTTNPPPRAFPAEAVEGVDEGLTARQGAGLSEHYLRRTPKEILLRVRKGWPRERVALVPPSERTNPPTGK